MTPRVLHPSLNAAHYLAWIKFRASLEPHNLAESIAAAEFLAWRESLPRQLGENLMFATFERFELRMTLAQAQSASHQGQCDEDVAYLCTLPAIARQIRKIGPDKIRAELSEYGAWDAAELSDNEANARRIVWLAAGNINEAN